MGEPSPKGGGSIKSKNAMKVITKNISKLNFKELLTLIKETVETHNMEGFIAYEKEDKITFIPRGEVRDALYEAKLEPLCGVAVDPSDEDRGFLIDFEIATNYNLQYSYSMDEEDNYDDNHNILADMLSGHSGLLGDVAFTY